MPTDEIFLLLLLLLLSLLLSTKAKKQVPSATCGMLRPIHVMIAIGYQQGHYFVRVISLVGQDVSEGTKAQGRQERILARPVGALLLLSPTLTKNISPTRLKVDCY